VACGARFSAVEKCTPFSPRQAQTDAVMAGEEQEASKEMEALSVSGEAGGQPKKDRAAVKAERAAARGAKQAAPVVAEDDPLGGNYGDVALVQSAAVTGRTWTRVSDFADGLVGQRVLVRGRVHTVRGKGKSAFLILRQGTVTLQVRADHCAHSPSVKWPYVCPGPLFARWCSSWMT
jgi:hypothetical protein